jgi:hypothetical protein
MVAQTLTAHVLQTVQLHHHHRHLQIVRFNIITQSIGLPAVGKQPLLLLHAVKLLFVVVQLHRLLLHPQPLIAILATATEALVELTVTEFGV